MRREVLVVRTLPNGRAEVVMDRPSACGGSCESCGGCAGSRAAAIAENLIGAQPGEIVEIEGRTQRLLVMTAIVYLLPLALLAVGLALTALLWHSPAPGAMVGFAAGVLLVILYGRRESRQPPVYRIVARR